MSLLTAERTDVAAPIEDVVPAEPPTPAPGRPPRLLLIVPALALIALWRLWSFVSAPESEVVPAPAAAPPVTAPTTTVPPAPTALESELPWLQAFVAGARGLAFERPVQASLLEDAEFRARLGLDEELDEEATAAMELTGRILKAMGLLDPDADLLEDMRAASATGIVGFYDHETDELYVRGTEMNAYSRLVLVHELTHALDDQHFGLERIAEQGDLEESLAFRALVEGSAVDVENQYRATLGAADIAEIERVEARLGADMEKLNLEVAYYAGAFPYIDGPRFVDALLEAGGQAALDRAFRFPPRTTAEILVPPRYLAGVSGARMTAPAVEGPIVESGMFGALGLYLVLQAAVDPESAGLAALSWEGDTYVAWVEGERTCVRVRFLLGSPGATAFTAEAFDRWATRQIDAVVEAPGTLRVTSCR